ncbi:MAG: GMC family oxidoreductase [Verrucomicrobiales bacterium]|nr:GMC family oxidoreductase [Verrucomicrobiales bacterium]
MKSAEEFDAVIVGSGAGGGTMAFGLTRKKMRVLILEAGPRFNPFEDYKLAEETWEQQGFPHKPESEGRQTFAELQEIGPELDDLQSWNAVAGRTNPTKRRSPHKYHHVRGVGGSTLAFTGESHRLHPDAMQMKTRFGVAADWPVDYKTLEPFYSEAERIIGVAGPENPGARWRSEPYPLPAHAPGFPSQKLKAGAEQLGYQWDQNSRAALSKPYHGRPNCNYCANCNRGCPRTDKGSVDVTFLRKSEATGLCTIRTGVTVLRIEAGEDDRVKGVHVIDEEGTSEFIPTRRLVVSCGAVETPRLLFASGIGNESGQVGKNFMETIAWTSSGLHTENLGSYRGLPGDSICWDFNAPDAIGDGVVGGVRFSTGVGEAALNGPTAYARRVVGGWGESHKKRMREVFGHVLSVGSIGESLPNPGSFIDLDPEQKDANGIPLARIHSHLGEGELKRLDFMAKTAREILKASGVTELVEEYGSLSHFSATHVFGTCRMGENPDDSVVDEFGRSHRWKNLQIMDASVFPSSGGGESPSLTIEALALRAAAGGG